MFHIRSFQHDDSQQISNIEEMLQPQSAWSLTQIQASNNSQHNNLVAIDDQHNIIGYIMCPYIFDEAEIHNVAVHPDHQRQGVAQQLITTLIRELAILQMQSIFLEVRESNTRALALYQKTGFVHIDIRKNYYPSLEKADQREHAIIMQYHFA